MSADTLQDFPELSRDDEPVAGPSHPSQEAAENISHNDPAPLAPDGPASLLPDFPVTHTRSGRQRRVPKRHADFVPSNLKEIPLHMQEYWKQRLKPTLAQPPPSPSPPPDQEGIATAFLDTPGDTAAFPDEDEPLPQYFDTEPNIFGIFRRYTTLPQRDPEAGKSPLSFIDSPAISKPSTEEEGADYPKQLRCFGTKISRGVRDKIIAPLLNISIFRIMHWFYSNTGVKSIFDLETLIREVLLADDFNTEELRGFNADKVLHSLDNFDPTSATLTAQDGWHLASVKIPVPKEGHKYPSESDALTYTIDGLYHRKPLQVIIAGYEDPILGKQLHHIPHREYVKIPTSGKSLISSYYFSFLMTYLHS